MPCDRVNQTRLAVEYAVPTPSLALEVQRGGIPGRPKATPALADLSSLIASPQIERSEVGSKSRRYFRYCRANAARIPPCSPTRRTRPIALQPGVSALRTSRQR